MKRFIILLVASALLISFTSCGERKGLWGLYKSAQENGNYESVEFAYSKVIYIPDQGAVRDEGDENGDDGRDEGWYKQTENTVICSFTDNTDDGVITTEMIFDYDEENDSLILTKIKTTHKYAGGTTDENTEDCNTVFDKGE